MRAAWLGLLFLGCNASFVDEQGYKVAQLPADVVIVDLQSLGGRCDDARTAEMARSVKTPWCTLDRALAATPRGWPVRVRAGTYPRLTATSPSARSAELVLGPFPDERVELQGARLKDQQLLALEGLVITRTVELADGNGTLRFSDCDFTTPDGLPPVYLQAEVAGLVVEGSHFHDLPNGSDPVSGRAIQGDAGGSDFRFVGNTFERMGATGIRVQYTDRVTVEANVFREVAEPLLFIGVSNAFIRRNRIFGTDAPVGLRSVSQLVFEDNLLTGFGYWAVSFDGVQGGLFRNNTAYGNGKGGFDFQSSAVSGVVLQNNVLQTLDGISSGVDFEDYNLVTEGKHSGAHDLVVTPLFMDAASGDFHLAPGSPGIDAALADSAPEVDLEGRAREDDPAVPNTGAGTPAYGDLGAFEGR